MKPQPMIFHGYETVMFGDTDASGIGHFAHQVQFLERAEFLFMKHVNLPPTQWFIARYLFPRVHLEVDYTSPLHFADEMRLDVRVGHLGNSSYSLLVDVFNVTREKVAMKSRLVMAVLDPKTGRPTPLPQELRDAFTPYLVEE